MAGFRKGVRTTKRDDRRRRWRDTWPVSCRHFGCRGRNLRAGAARYSCLRASAHAATAMDLSRFPRRRYTQGYTPIEPLHHLSRALAGPEIHLKRDDMLGLFPGGNKTR